MAALGFLVLGGEPKPVATGSQTIAFMRQKLVYSDRILEGLVLDKLDLVSTNAVLLRNMNLTNAFLTLNNADYLRAITNFQNRADFLIVSAKQGDLERSTEAYALLTKSCVNCHQQFRRDQFRKANQTGP